jgi:hypothetical protein
VLSEIKGLVCCRVVQIPYLSSKIHTIFVVTDDLIIFPIFGSRCHFFSDSKWYGTIPYAILPQHYWSIPKNTDRKFICIQYTFHKFVFVQCYPSEKHKSNYFAFLRSLHDHSAPKVYAAIQHRSQTTTPSTSSLPTSSSSSSLSFPNKLPPRRS